MPKPTGRPEALIALTPPPGWVRPQQARFELADATLFAGAALAALDPIVRANAPFEGVWRRRLALRAAVATVRVTGRREAEADLRDAWFLRATGAELGPAGEHLRAWRMLASNSSLSPEGLARVALAFGLGAATPVADLIKLCDSADDANPIRLAAETAAAVARLHPAAELVGLWLADFVLARRLRWPRPLPLLAAQISDPALRRGANAGAGRPGGEGWETLIALAYARGAASAIDLAGELSRRAAKLIAERGKLRAKGAGKVVDALLEEDALAPAARIGGMSDRSMRRLVDRLVALGAARELTNRPTFRLYGL